MLETAELIVLFETRSSFFTIVGRLLVKKHNLKIAYPITFQITKAKLKLSNFALKAQKSNNFLLNTENCSLVLCRIFFRTIFTERKRFNWGKK